MAAQRVLLVHDNPDCRRIYGAVLVHDGYDVTATDDGDEALRLFSQGRWTLIVTHLFVRSRVDECFIRLLNRSVPVANSRPPAIVLATYASDELRRLAADEGADAFILLPITPSDFLAVVHDLLAPTLPPHTAYRPRSSAERPSTQLPP